MQLSTRFVSLLATLLIAGTCATACGTRAGDKHNRPQSGGLQAPVPGAPAPDPARPDPLSCTLSAGFAEASMTPDLSNGRPAWIAGFGNGRRATSVHDEIKAIAMVLDDGVSRVGIVGLDAIGYMHNEVERVRAELPEDLKIDYLIIASTHNHEVPDLIGIWGKDFYHSGVDSEYQALVRNSIKTATRDAVGRLSKVCVTRAEIANVGTDIVDDTRFPMVFDPNVYMLRFASAQDGRTVGTFVTWANHPEVLWSSNTAITADFVGYLRDGISKGISRGQRVVRSGLGGTTLYLNGSIGGLMTTLDSMPVPDFFTGEKLIEPSFAKAESVGFRVAAAVLDVVGSNSEVAIEKPSLSFLKKDLKLAVNNLKFRAAATAGIIPRKFTGWFQTESEVALLRIGDTWIATVPGELYPEIANGGIEVPPEGDFSESIKTPVEIPAFRSVMRGKMNMILGLANDQIGYIIPKTEWDAKKPWAFGEPEAPYGEENSLGPNTAPAIHAALLELFRYF